MAQIEDLANLGLNFWIAVDNNADWPTPTFTIRYTPAPSEGSNPPPVTETLCTDGLDNDSDGLFDCSDPDCSGISTCGPEGRLTTCSDGFDNDATAPLTALTPAAPRIEPAGSPI